MTDVFTTAEVSHFSFSRTSDESAPVLLSPEAFSVAWHEITRWPGYASTPLVSLPGLAHDLGLAQIRYKDEGPRFGLGSFKALGGAYAALRVLQRELTRQLGHGVTLEDIRAGQYTAHCADITMVSATDGNHGRSLAWGCQRFGAACQIFIHAEVSESRAQAMRDFGAHVTRIDGDYDDSVALAREEADRNGWFVVSDTSWDGYVDPPCDVMAGYGIMTREICNALPLPPTHVFLQGGVGGLAGSVAEFLRQYWGARAPHVVVVEPNRAACLIESARNGQATTVQIKDETIMAGLSCGDPSALAWDILRREASDFLTIPDSLVAPTMRLLASGATGDPRIDAGESAVAGLAALIACCRQPDLRAALALDADSRALLIGSEGVTDPEIFATIMAGGGDADA